MPDDLDGVPDGRVAVPGEEVGLLRRHVGQEDADGQDQHSSGGPGQLVDDGVVAAQNGRDDQADEQ